MNKLLIMILSISILLLSGCSEPVSSLGTYPDERIVKFEEIANQIETNEKTAKKKEIKAAQKVKEEERIEKERVIAAQKAKEEAEQKERERVAEEQRQAELDSQQAQQTETKQPSTQTQQPTQKKSQSNDSNGDGFIDQSEWAEMNGGEQSKWTEEFIACTDAGKSDCERE